MLVTRHGKPRCNANLYCDGLAGGVSVCDGGAGVWEKNEFRGNAVFQVSMQSPEKLTGALPDVDEGGSSDSPTAPTPSGGQEGEEGGEGGGGGGEGGARGARKNPALPPQVSSADTLRHHLQGLARFECNVIHKSKGNGVVVEGGKAGFLVNNTIDDHAQYGVQIKAAASCLLENNTISACLDCGVLASGCAASVMEGNTLTGNKHGIVVAGGALTVIRNTVEGCTGNGIVMGGTPLGKVISNHIRSPAMFCLLVEGAMCDPVIKGNFMRDAVAGGGGGILVRGGGRGSFHGNEVFFNEVGVTLDGAGTQPCLRCVRLLLSAFSLLPLN